MSTFNNGGGDLVSTNMPAALLELFQKTQSAEIAANIDNIQITYDSDALTATAAAALPCTFAADGTTGKVVVTASNYINGDTFAPGAGGDLVSTYKASALLELIQKVQTAEAGNGIDNVQITFDEDAGTASLSAALPISFAVNGTSGIVEMTASDYLP